MHQEPVYVDPHGPSPVSLFREPVAVQVVARYGRDVLVRQTEPVVLQGVEHAPCSILAGDTSIQRSSEVWPEVNAYGPVVGEIVVQVYPAILVPEFLVDSTLRLLRQFIVGRRVLANDSPYLGEISVGLAQERVKQHILYQEGAIRSYPGLVVVAISEELDQVGEPVVSGAGRTVRGGDGVDVGAVVWGDLVCPK